ncbi:MAG: iron complex transport system substrate-binding protein [Planctomycetota bacterium]|jgi:iron complex transport system substrate-binding protein
MHQRNAIGLRSCILLGMLMSCGDSSKDLASQAPIASTPPQRIIPTNASAVDFVLDLVDASRVVAVPDTIMDYATVDIDLTQWKADARFSEFSAEVLLAHDPDMVIVSPWQDQNTIDRVIESGVRVIELPPVAGLEDIRESIRVVAQGLHAMEQAESLLAHFDARAEELRQAAEKRGDIRGLVYTNYGSGGWAAGGGTTAHHILDLAGVRNSVLEAGRSGHDMVSIEEMLTMNPDVLVISKPSRDYGVTRKYLEEDKSLAHLDAVKNGRIIELPAALFSTTSHHLLEAAEYLARELDKLISSGMLEAQADRKPSKKESVGAASNPQSPTTDGQ